MWWPQKTPRSNPFAQLREFSEFWQFDVPSIACCLTADEDLEDDPDVCEDCNECPVAHWIDTLDAPNREAWRLYRQVVTRFTVDAQAIPLVLSRITADYDVDSFTELLDRFAVLHDVMCPPRSETSGE